MDVEGIADRRVLARFDRPRSSRSTRIAVLGDVHLALDAEGTPKTLDRTETHLRRAVSAIRGSDLDGVCFLGDLTSDGSDPNARSFARIADGLEGTVTGVAGNYERPPVPSPLGPYVGEGPFPVGERIGDLTLVGLDSRGGLDDDQLDRLDRRPSHPRWSCARCGPRGRRSTRART